MAYKMKGFSGFGNSPIKQKVDPDAPGTPGKPGYEPPVRYEDLDEKGKAIWDKLRKSRYKNIPAGDLTRPEDIKEFDKTKKKKSGPLKQGSQHEKMYEVEEQMSYIEEDLEDSDEYLTSQGKNRKELKNKLAKLTNKRDSIHSKLKGGNIKPGYTEGERDKSKDVKYPK